MNEVYDIMIEIQDYIMSVHNVNSVSESIHLTEINKMVNKAINAIDEKVPSVQRLGKWIIHKSFLICNQCDAHVYKMDIEGYPVYRNFCPNCGADMREV